MKGLFFLLAVAFLFTTIGCSTPEKSAEKLIKAYMMENLKDPSSYEPVSFSKLDSLFSPYIDTNEGKELFKLGGITGEYHKKSFDFHTQAMTTKSRIELDMLSDSALYYQNKADEYEKLYKEKEAAYQGEFIGWIIEHRYRAKNSFGALDFEDQNFYFDKDVTKINEPYGKRSKN